MFKIVGFISIVASLFWVFYSLAGGTPLLIAKYDTPNDSRLVRGFFNLHYRGLLLITGLGALCFFLASENFLATAMAYEVAFATIALLFLVSRMNALHDAMTASNVAQGPGFRKLISSALALNIANIVAILWFVSQSTLITCVKTPPDCVLGQQADGAPCKHLCSLF